MVVHGTGLLDSRVVVVMHGTGMLDVQGCSGNAWYWHARCPGL